MEKRGSQRISWWLRRRKNVGKIGKLKNKKDFLKWREIEVGVRVTDFLSDQVNYKKDGIF